MSGFTPTAIYEDVEPTIGPSKKPEDETKEVENTTRETTAPETTGRRPQTDDPRTTVTSDTVPSVEPTTRPAETTPTREPERTTEREPERETQPAPESENTRTTPERENTATTGTPVRGTDFVDATVTRPGAATPSPSVDSSQNSDLPQEPEDSSSSKGLIVGGIVAGVVAVAVLAFAFWWIKRRKRRAMHNEAAAFDASDFRRSAMLLNDPPTHADILAQGYGSGSGSVAGPRPPSMFQHRIASPAPTFGTQYGLPPPAMAYAQDTSSPVSYGINGQNYPAPYSPYTPSSADHLAPGNYSPSPYSPGFGDSRSMNHHNSYQSNIASSRASDQESYGRSDQVDLERSSVSPYQVAQYAEISRQLNTEVPQGLNTPTVQEYMHQSNTGYGAPAAVVAAASIPPAYVSRPSSPSYAVPAEKLPSPFENADRDSYPREKEAQGTAPAPSLASHDSVQSFGAVPHLDFPAPPAVDSQHNRVESTPPILPEISVSRDSYGFPAPAIIHHSEGNNGTLQTGHMFPTTPSPLKSTFSHEAIAESTPASAPSPARAQEKPAAKRPDTVYDEGDVYGGI